MGKNWKLDFLVIGTPRSATTWLNTCLEEHPEVCVSRPKEIHFFNRQSHCFWRPEVSAKYALGMDWYRSHFSHCSADQIKGEIGTLYLYDNDAPRLITKHFPSIKLIILLRNPAERLYSHYLHVWGKQRYPISDSIDAVIRKERKFVEQGFYHHHIKRYLDYVNREQILILIYEDMAKDPTLSLQSVFRFLGVDSSFRPPSTQRRIHSAAINQSLIRRLYFREIQRLSSGQTGPFGRVSIKLLRFLRLTKMINSVINALASGKVTYRQMPLHVRWTLNEVYLCQTKKIENLIGRDLGFWKR